jgi:trk system potassium uptake protein TrkH
MHGAIIFRILGILLMLFSLTLLVPLSVSIFYQDGEYFTFLVSFLIIFLSGLTIWTPFYKASAQLRTRDGFLITSLFWSVLGIFGSVPFMIGENISLSFADAAFESISGLTTTGATVITGLDFLPKSILFYRQQLHWLGGIGIIVIAVAVLPMLGIGGMQLYRTETPGPIKDSKLTPRITETAKWLFFTYFSMTVICTLAYWLAGMNTFDAICHSFSTIATGGFANYDASIGHYQSPVIWLLACFFMFISSINFGMHYYTWHRMSIRHYFTDSEAKFFFFFIVVATCITLTGLYSYHYNSHLEHAWIQALFHVISMASTTGFATTDITVWPGFIPLMLLFLGAIGGCAGSTAGGVKAIRIILIAKQGLRELRQLIHPNAVIPIKLKKRTVPDSVLSAVWSFLAVYLMVFILLFFALDASGLDMETSFSATVSTLNNIGPGLGQVSSNFSSVSDLAKWMGCLAMLLGRLEIFTLLVLFTPAFWRK